MENKESNKPFKPERLPTEEDMYRQNEFPHSSLPVSSKTSSGVPDDPLAHEMIEALRKGVSKAQEAKADRLEKAAKEARTRGETETAIELEALAKRYRAHEDGLPSA